MQKSEMLPSWISELTKNYQVEMAAWEIPTLSIVPTSTIPQERQKKDQR